MLPKLEKHMLILATLVASLSITACGSKKEVMGGPKPETTQEANTETQATNGSAGQELPNPFEEPASNAPEGRDGKGGTFAPPVFEVKPVGQEDYNPVPDDYRSYEASVDRNVSKKLTGAITDDGYLYTSTSTDDIHTFLRARNERVSWATKQANLAAAAAVQSAKISTDGLSGDAIITLKIDEGRSTETYVLAGYVDQEDGYATPVKTVRASATEKTTGRLPLSGTLKCLDLDGGCETMFLRLVYGSQGSSSVINVIFRKSAADIHFNLPSERSGNVEYEYLRDFILFSIHKKPGTNERIKKAEMSSWEVVNGRSGVSLLIRGYNREFLGFAGPLLAPEAGSGVNIRMSRLANGTEDSFDLINDNNVRLNYANSIGDIRMVANNGLGQVKLVAKMRKRGNFKQDRFAMTFMRKIKPIVELTDDNLK